MFEEYNELEYLDLSSFDTTKVTKMVCMFNGCSKLKEINGINNFDISKINNLKKMFEGCYELKYLDLSNFNTSKVKDMTTLFNQCYELEYLDLSNFDTTNVTDMSYMFTQCQNMKEIKGINNFNTKKVKNMLDMFQGCCELKDLDLSNFDTSNVIDMRFMFSLCNKLKEIKGIKNFIISDNTKIIGIFAGCDELDLYKFNNSEEIKNNYKELLSKLTSITSNVSKLFEIKKQKININFISSELQINYSITCYNTDIFHTIKLKLLAAFPELKKKFFYLLANGNNLDIKDEYGTFIQNGIKNDSSILIYYKEKKDIFNDFYDD